MRKVVFAISLLASGFVIADGFYAGGQFGAEQIQIERRHYLDFANPSDYHTFRKGTSNSHANGGLYGGYKIDLKNKLRVAFELDAFLLSRTINTKLELVNITPVLPNDEFKEGLKFKESYGLSVLLGYALSDKTEVYGRLGVSYQSFRFDSLDDAEPTLYSGLNNSQKLNPFGLVLGCGIETSLAGICKAFENVKAFENIYVRADYRYIKYQRSTMRWISASGGDVNYISSARFNLTKHMVMLGVDYRF